MKAQQAVHNKELHTSVNDIAERVPSQACSVIGTFRQVNRQTCFTEEPSIPDADARMKWLVEDQETVIRTAHNVISYKERSSDLASLDLMTDRIEMPDKLVWLPRSFLAS